MNYVRFAFAAGCEAAAAPRRTVRLLDRALPLVDGFAPHYELAF